MIFFIAEHRPKFQGREDLCLQVGVALETQVGPSVQGACGKGHRVVEIVPERVGGVFFTGGIPYADDRRTQDSVHDAAVTAVLGDIDIVPAIVGDAGPYFKDLTDGVVEIELEISSVDSIGDNDPVLFHDAAGEVEPCLLIPTRDRELVILLVGFPE